MEIQQVKLSFSPLKNGILFIPVTLLLGFILLQISDFFILNDFFYNYLGFVFHPGFLFYVFLLIISAFISLFLSGINRIRNKTFSYQYIMNFLLYNFLGSGLVIILLVFAAALLIKFLPGPFIEM